MNESRDTRRRNLQDVSTQPQLRQYIKRKMGTEFKQHSEMTKAEVIEQAMVIRKWLSTIVSFSNKELLLEHEYISVISFLQRLERYEGGLWCAGIAKLYADILYQVYGIPSATFAYGYSETGLSHVTTVVGYREKKDVKFTVIDAYLGFHYEDGFGEILSLDEVLAQVIAGKADEIERVDVKLPRSYISMSNNLPDSEKWLFENNVIPEPTRQGGVSVYPGALVSVPKLYCHNSTMMNLALDVNSNIRSETDLNVFLMEMMLVEPELSRINIVCQSCFADSRMAHSLFAGVARGIQRRNK